LTQHLERPYEDGNYQGMIVPLELNAPIKLSNLPMRFSEGNATEKKQKCWIPGIEKTNDIHIVVL
jgi:hypothetical protein